MGLRCEAREAAAKGICWVCGGPMVWEERVYRADYGCVMHHGCECERRFQAEARAYDRSRRGRWRPVNEVLLHTRGILRVGSQ